MMKGTFRSLDNPHYRLWAGAGFVSHLGTWIQRIAQDWLVLTGLTDNSATAVGFIMALQFGPALLLLPLTGYAADRLDRRTLVIATQGMQALLALGLGLLTLGGVVALWHVYVFALLLGCTTAFDGPARQTLLTDLVGEERLSNAMALNGASFNLARMVGPALAGALIATIGTGGVFLINAATFVVVLVAVARIKTRPRPHPPGELPGANRLTEGFRYLWARPDMKVMLAMLFLVATFGLNSPIFISVMTVRVFHSDVSSYGFLTAMLAVGSVAGALISARQESPTLPTMIVSAALFGLACALAAIAPSMSAFAATLVAIGFMAQIFSTASNTLLQLAAEPAVRGRIVSIVLAVFVGTTLIGAPFMGWVADVFGPRWALGGAAASGLTAAAIGLAYRQRRA